MAAMDETCCEHERKLHILHIPHILLQKVINEQRLELSDGTLTGQQALRFILEAQKKFSCQAISYLVQSRDD